MKKNILFVSALAIFTLTVFNLNLSFNRETEIGVGVKSPLTIAKKKESKYEVNLDGKQENSADLSTYFMNAKTIILESKEDCYIGQINEIQVFNKYIFILDRYIAKSLFVFDRNGSFVRRIGNLGQGPGDYIQLEDFTVDQENGFIFLLDYGERVHKYRFDGSFVQTTTIKVKNANVNFIQYYNNKLYLSVLPYKPTSDDFMLMEMNLNNGEILSKTLPYKYNKGWAKPIIMGHSFFISRSNNLVLYSQTFMDNIVHIGANIELYIELKSKNLVTYKDIDNISKSIGTRAVFNSFSEYFRDNSKIFDVNSYVENDDFIFFRYQRGYINYNWVILNKKSASVNLVKNLNRDLIFKNDANRFFGGFAFFDSKGVYDILNSAAILSFQESIRNNEVIPDLDKANELLKLDAEANPVIFYYEFK